jgi:hypothetical protein
MSASQQLRLIGGPVETIARTMQSIELSLRKSIKDEGELAVRLVEIRQFVGQAVLDGYSAGRREPLPALVPPPPERPHKP